MTLDLADYESWTQIKRLPDKAYANLKVYCANNPLTAQRNVDYTGAKFMKEFRNVMRTFGFSDNVIKQIRNTAETHYGMYALMQVNEEFLREWEDLVGQQSIELYR